MSQVSGVRKRWQSEFHSVLAVSRGHRITGSPGHGVTGSPGIER
jgi:hypothetical protein